MNQQSAKLFLGMLESIHSFSSENDIALVEAVREGFLALIEGSLNVDLSSVGGRVMPSIYVPTEQDTVENVSRTGKKSFNTISASDASSKINAEAAQQDILKWFYHAVQTKDLSTDLVRFILFNTGKPMVTVTGLEDMSLPKDIVIDMSTHPLWDAVKDQVSKILSSDPDFSGMKNYFTNAVKSNEQSLIHKSRTAGVGDIASIVKEKDALAAQRQNVSMGSLSDIANQREAAAEETRKLASEQTMKRSEDSMKREAERRERNANMSLSDMHAKIKADEKPTPKTMAELIAAKQKEDEDKKAKFAKLNSMFKTGMPT